MHHFVPKWSAKERVALFAIADGSHWSRQVQLDVVGINWQMREIRLGECKRMTFSLHDQLPFKSKNVSFQKMVDKVEKLAILYATARMF